MSAEGTVPFAYSIFISSFISMNKNFFKTVIRGAVGLAAASLMGLVSCQDEEGLDDEQQKGSVTVDSVYSVRIPATLIYVIREETKSLELVNDTTLLLTNDTTDIIYLYNETKKCFACRYDAVKDCCWPIKLHPSEILDEDFVIAGDVSFYRYNDSCKWEMVRVDDGDVYSLFYGHYWINLTNYRDVYFSSDYQSGTADDLDESVFGECRDITLKKEGNKLVYNGDKAGIEILTTFFRLDVVFTDESGDTISVPGIEWIELDTRNKTHVLYYSPLLDGEGRYKYDYMDLDSIKDSKLYFFMPFHYNESNTPTDDSLMVFVYDVDDNEYFGTVDLPEEGIIRGAYYINEITLQKKVKTIK